MPATIISKTIFEKCGHIENYLGISKIIWAYRKLFGYIESYLSISKIIWAFRKLFGHIENYLGISKIIWAYRKLFGYKYHNGRAKLLHKAQLILILIKYYVLK